MAIHPLGLLIAVAFPSRVRIMVPLLDDMMEEKDLPLKHCRQLTFSHGGHYLAIGQGSNVILIGVPNYEATNTLKGPAGLCSLAWSLDDQFLATAAADGRVSEWHVSSQQCETDSPERRVWSCLTYLPTERSLLLSASDALQLRRMGQPLHDMTISGDQSLSHLRWVKFPVGTGGTGGAIVGGTASGKVRAMALSLLQGGNGSTAERWLHSGAVTAVAVSQCGTVAVTAGEDGAVTCLQVVADAPRASLAGLVTVPTGEWHRLSAAWRSAEAAVTAAKAEGVAAVQREAVQWAERVRRAEERERVAREAVALPPVTTEEVVSELDSTRMAEEVEAQLHRQINDLALRCESLKAAKDDMQFQLEEKIQVLVANQRQILDDARKEWELKLKAESEKSSRLKKEFEFVSLEHEEEIEQQEEEHDIEITQSQEKSGRVIQIERDHAMSLKGDNNMLRRKCEALTQEYELLQGQIFEKDKEVQKTKRKVQELEETIEGLKKEVDERNYTIGQKEYRILEVKQKNQELEKYRFVLDYRMNELKGELNPKELLMSEMRGQIKDMDEELQRTLHNNDQLELIVADRNLKIETLQKEVRQFRHQIAEREKFIKLFVEDLHNLYTQKDSSEWRAGIKQMYQIYVTQDSKRRITKEDKERMQGKQRKRITKNRTGPSAAIHGTFTRNHETKSCSRRRENESRRSKESRRKRQSHHVFFR